MVISQVKVPLLLMETWQAVRYSGTEHPAWTPFKYESKSASACLSSSWWAVVVHSIYHSLMEAMVPPSEQGQEG